MHKLRMENYTIDNILKQIAFFLHSESKNGVMSCNWVGSEVEYSDYNF